MKNIYIDFDNVIVNTTKAVVDVYNETFKEVDGFVPGDYTKVKSWGFTDQCPLMHKQYVYEIFSMNMFWDNVEMFPDALESINRLREEYNVTIVTKGDLDNAIKKMAYIKQQFGEINTLMISGNYKDYYTGKEMINMKDGFFLDDLSENLFSQDGDVTCILVDINKADSEYNKDWDGLVIHSWKSLFPILEMSKESVDDND